MPSKTEDLPDDLDTTINPYKVLGVEKSATADEIKSAYRKQALKNHPGTSLLAHIEGNYN
jgi:DnaJ family protein C protein 9